MRSVFFLLLCFTAVYTTAQTCTGSLGDPIVNVTFGAGTNNFGPPLPFNTTSSLAFEAANCPVDGSYAITNYTAGCWPADVVWHTATDHTGNSHGYFMLINASHQPSDFYIQTVSGLCEGTQYQFAAWLLNMCSVTGELPDVTMTIETTSRQVLAKYETGKIKIVNPLTWKQYGFNFTTPAGVSTVVLRMRNNAPGGVGNDVGLDDITFRPIGPLVSIEALEFTGDTAALCEDNTTPIQFVASVEQCYLSTAYQWQWSTDNGLTWKDIAGAVGATYDRQLTTAGTYLYRLAAAQQNNIGITTCRVTSAPFKVIVYPVNGRTISISKSTGAICDGSAVTFTAQTTNGGNAPAYQWQVNGKAAGTNSSTYTSNTLKTGDVVNCVFTSSLPCNSPAVSNSISILVGHKTTSIIDTTICEGESYAGYTVSGTYTDVLVGNTGCDSTRVLHLLIKPRQQTLEDTTICYGENYYGHVVSGTYTTTYTGANGCDSVHTINLTVLPDINRKVWNDTLLCTGDSIVLSPGNWDAYLWQDGSTKSSYKITRGGIYSVVVSNSCGSATKQISVTEQVCNIAFPSAFTPNGDGLNDVFKAVNAYHLAAYRFVVYNRWGQQIFETTNPAIGWNGYINSIAAATGVYIWKCDYKKEGNVNVVNMNGVVTLLR